VGQPWRTVRSQEQMLYVIQAVPLLCLGVAFGESIVGLKILLLVQFLVTVFVYFSSFLL
jgi:hypothetical protein